MTPLNIGVIGCGTISGAYLKNLVNFRFLKVVALCDMNTEMAQQRAEEFGIERIITLDEMLGDPSIDVVINLTPPAGHFPISKLALEAGKHVFNEKPLSIDRDEARTLVQLAKEKNLRLGCAPDTVLGGGLQSARKFIDDGWIGRPLAASAFMTGAGVEGWHPSPDFYYKKGGGPLFDMGPYYLTALITLLGPVQSVVGMTSRGFAQRTITTEKRFGEKIDVEIDTHATGSLRFANGAVGTLITSFEVRKSSLPRIEIYGETGTLVVPDPNTFGGSTRYAKSGKEEWKDLPIPYVYTENFRGLGLADMVSSIQHNRAHRANGDLAFHALDIMHGIYESSASGKFYQPETQPERPAAMPLGMPEGILD